jgi:hypothetical protein
MVLYTVLQLDKGVLNSLIQEEGSASYVVDNT